MKSIAWFFAVGLVSAAVLSAAVNGCSSSPIPKGNDQDSDGGTGSNTPLPPANPTPPTNPGDGGTDAAVAPVSNPGKVTCGAAECDTSGATGNCCWPNNSPTGATCKATCPGTNELAVTCDETADCNADNGEVCCVEFGQAICLTQEECQGVGDIRLCKATADCQQGETCGQRTCKRGDPGSQVSLPFRVCGTGATPIDCPN